MTDPSDISNSGGDGADGDVARAGEYVVGLLAQNEREVFEKRLRGEPALRRMVADWEADLVPLFDDVDDVTAPPHVWTAIQTRLFQDVQTRLTWWQRLGVGQAILGAVVAGAIAWVAVSQGWLVPDTAAPQVVAELQGQGALFSAVVAVDVDNNTLILTRNTPEAEAGRDHELWLIVDDAAPVSLGVLPREHVFRIAVDAGTVAVLNGATLAVSDEPAGGSTTGAPTGAVLAASAVSFL